MKQSKFQFINPYLKEAEFKTNPDFIPDDTEFVMQNSFHVHVRRTGKEKRANVELELETNRNTNNAPFQLHVRVASDFKWEDLDEDTIEKLLNSNAPALLLSYMRPIVANLTNVSNLPVYNLPFVNFKAE